MPNTITNRQMFLILFMTLIAIASGDISKVMVQSAGTSGWITILLTAVLFALAAYAWAKLNGMHEGKTLFEYSKGLVGRVGAYFLSLYFAQYFFTVLAGLNIAMATLLQTNFLPNTPGWATTLACIAVIGFIAYKGVTNAARLVEIYGVILLAVAIPVHLIMFFQGHIAHILPLFNPAETVNAVTSVKEMIFSFLGIEVLAVIPLTAKNGRAAAKTAFGAVIAVGLYYVLNALGCVMMIGENEIVHYQFPLVAAIRQVELPFLKILQRIDLLYLTVGFIGLLAGFSIIYLNIVELICRMVPKVKRIIVVVSVGCLSFAAYCFLSSVADIQKTLIDITTLSGLFVAILVPLALLVITMVKKREKKKLSILLLISLWFLPAAGCWDARDINDRNVLTAVAVDKTDYGYAFYVEVPPLSGGTSSGDSGQKKPAIVKSEGRTLAETRDDLDRKMDRPIFLGAVQTVILTERLACYGIEEYLLRLRQIFDYRKTVHVVVTPDDPEKLLRATSEHSESAGFAIYDTIESLVGGGMLYERSLMDILERLSSPYKHFSIPTFSLVDDEFTFTGLTVFSGGIKTGFIPAADINPMVFVKNKSAKAKYTVEYKDTKASIDVVVSRRKIRPNLDGERVSFELEMGFKAILMYPGKNKPITDEDMAIIQATLKAMLEQEFATLFAKSQQEYHHDVFNLFEQFQNAYPEEFKQMNWAEEYEKVTLNLFITVKLDSTGLIDYNPEG